MVSVRKRTEKWEEIIKKNNFIELKKGQWFSDSKKQKMYKNTKLEMGFGWCRTLQDRYPWGKNKDSKQQLE